MNEHRTLARPGMEANKCSGDLSAHVGVGRKAAINRSDVLRAYIVVESYLIDGIAIYDEALEVRIFRLVKRRREMFAITDPIVLGDGTAATHRSECKY